MSAELLRTFRFLEGNFLWSSVLFLTFAAIGATVRWRVQKLRIWKVWVGTLSVNAVSSFLVGLLIASNPGNEIITVVSGGLLGSLSTFSTIIMQAAERIEARKYSSSLFVIGMNIVLGVLFAYIGLEIGDR
mgnify:FL=1